ncbi:MAG: hypothetical protein R3208_20600 [Ketobacteraceae bacterium]|nr:hypothetical protein [Ketobacteraceae bacterium]
MFKKLVLLIAGAAASAAGFMYYTSLAPDEADALADSLSRQKVNLENIARDIAGSEVVQQVIHKGKEALAESPAVKQWLQEQLQTYAQEQKGVELSPQQSGELVDHLMALRGFSDSALEAQADGEEMLSREQQQRLEDIMARGDTAFQEHLGVPMQQFLVALSKSSSTQVTESQQ